MVSFPSTLVILRFLEVLSARRVTSWKKSVSLEHEWLAGEPGSHSASSWDCRCSLIGGPLHRDWELSYSLRGYTTMCVIKGEGERWPWGAAPPPWPSLCGELVTHKPQSKKCKEQLTRIWDKDKKSRFDCEVAAAFRGWLAAERGGPIEAALRDSHPKMTRCCISFVLHPTLVLYHIPSLALSLHINRP